MLMKILLMVITPLLFVSPALAVRVRLVMVGVMSASQCKLQHLGPGPRVADCVTACIAHGGRFILVSGGKLYTFEKQRPSYIKFAGNWVQVVCYLDGSKIAGDALYVKEVKGLPPANLRVWEGTITDSRHPARGFGPSADKSGSTGTWIGNGALYLLKSEDKVYRLDEGAPGDNSSRLQRLVGDRVEVIGILDGDVIHLREALRD